MAVETLFVPTLPQRSAIRPRWQRRLVARLRLSRMAARRELELSGLDDRQRTDMGRPAGRSYRWLDELMCAYRMR